ncbi:MAG: hypothetical protein HPY70_11370 [Firmicutes bacterium]|nr:hypothetical protein [Bacillota bacterium]
MEILVSIPESEWDVNSNLLANQHFIDEVLENLKPVCENVEVKRASMPLGADWSLLALLAGVLVRGKDINETMDNWIGIAKKFRNFVLFIKDRKLKVFVDRDSAKLIAFDYLNEHEEIKYIEDMDGQTVNVELYHETGVTDFIKEPLNLYVLFFKVNREKVYVFGIRSTTEIAFVYTIDIKNPHRFILGDDEYYQRSEA